MKIYSGFKFNADEEALKCPQCSSTFLESTSNIEVPEWQPGNDNKDSTKIKVTYTCSQCGHRFTSKDVEEKKRFKEGMGTLFFIFIMIVLLLIVLL